MTPLHFARGDKCLFKGGRWRVLYVTVDRSVALIGRGPDLLIVRVADLDLALPELRAS